MRELNIDKSITKRDSESFNRYLFDIGKIEMIKPDEEILLTQKIKAGDQAAFERLIKTNLRFVVSCAKKYQGLGLPISDLINEGNLGLIKAAKMFDETKGFKFISYAVWWIRQAIINAISENSRTVRVPMSHIIAIKKIREASILLEQNLERNPSLDEIIYEIDMPTDKIITCLHNDKKTISLDAPAGQDNDFSLHEIISDASHLQPDEVLEQDWLANYISGLLHQLPVRLQKILTELYGLGGKEAIQLEDVAKLNSLSRERIRQLRKSAFELMRNKIKAEQIKTGIQVRKHGTFKRYTNIN